MHCSLIASRVGVLTGTGLAATLFAFVPLQKAFATSPSLSTSTCVSMESTVQQARKELSALIQEKHCGPILIRLAWHDSGTYKAEDGSGGPRGCMRFAGSSSGTGESMFGANKGLDIARNLIADIKNDVASDMSYADFWALAAIVAVKEMGGPEVKFRTGRVDSIDVNESVEDGRLPDGAKGADHLREVFYRMGLTDQDIVALSGAHTVGRCHIERLGFDGPWTENPLTFDNTFFVDLLTKEYDEETTSAGCPQFRNKSTNTMMLISDKALVEDDKFRPFVKQYAEDQELFFKDFSNSFQKLLELGVRNLQEV